MTAAQKITLSGILFVLAVILIAIFSSPFIVDGTDIITPTIIFALLGFAIKFFSMATTLKQEIQAGFQYRLLNYKKEGRETGFVTFITFEFVNKDGNEVVHTFHDVNFETDVSMVNVGEEFTALVRDKKIVLVKTR